MDLNIQPVHPYTHIHMYMYIYIYTYSPRLVRPQGVWKPLKPLLPPFLTLPLQPHRLNTNTMPFPINICINFQRGRPAHPNSRGRCTMACNSVQFLLLKIPGMDLPLLLISVLIPNLIPRNPCQSPSPQKKRTGRGGRKGVRGETSPAHDHA